MDLIYYLASGTDNVFFRTAHLEEREQILKSLAPPCSRFSAALMAIIETLLSMYICIKSNRIRLSKCSNINYQNKLNHK
jgi:hypothetical protein